MKDNTTPDVPAIAALRELDQQATPGPWSPIRSMTCGHLRAAHNYNQNPYKEWTQQDIELIAAMRNALPALLDAAERLAATEKVLEQAVKVVSMRLNEGEILDRPYSTIDASLHSGGGFTDSKNYPDLAAYLRSKSASDAVQEHGV